MYAASTLAERRVERQVFDDTLAALETYFLLPLGAGDQLIQAHVPTAIAKLLGRDGPVDLVRHYKDLFLAELQRKGGVNRSSNHIYRSVVLALGKLARPNRGSQDPGPDYSRALLEYYRTGKDRQARYFALIGTRK